ncbi:LOW QUALITY PROTEIN: toll-like receptor 13 [Periophthalmus magnuspinnatus]|uniref:LOW QUALITY PROTEIN: toll-like receptor 13 n=1 Tax=Periophthalmus magnuspinnatus TaxID=409849 RepID=UPI00243720C9|nr:LOW QUALITY PROTEIN: toll-like receptor 13 [Periophthalmus magnuspinnatus]
MGPGRWAQGDGPRAMGPGRWAQGDGPRAMGPGRWAQGDGPRAMEASQRSEEGLSDFPFCTDSLQLLLGYSRAFPGQLRDTVPPVCPGSSQGPTPYINCEDFSHGPELFEPLKDQNVLDLTNNNIQSLDILHGANLTKVEKLILQNNKLAVINEAVFEALPSLKYLDLSGNPFACNCSNAGFISWAIRNKQVQVVNAFQYRCSSPPTEEGHFLLDFNVQLSGLRLLPPFGFLYDSKKKRQGCPDIYDAFVSYNVHDEDWVYGELLPELEGVQGWRLCLHHRDFQPGKPIIENITDAIYSSRKTLCVISRRYLQSEWCSREIQMASYRLFDEQKDVLILLFLEKISSNQLSPFYRMRNLVKSRTYLSWSQVQSHKGLFWENVRRALECGNEPADSHNPLTANVY